MRNRVLELISYLQQNNNSSIIADNYGNSTNIIGAKHMAMNKTLMNHL